MVSICKIINNPFLNFRCPVGYTGPQCQIEDGIIVIPHMKSIGAPVGITLFALVLIITIIGGIMTLYGYFRYCK
jgi:uncharacterized membrane protein YphA (DoxX/SURF4 family)